MKGLETEFNRDNLPEHLENFYVFFGTKRSKQPNIALTRFWNYSDDIICRHPATLGCAVPADPTGASWMK